MSEKGISYSIALDERNGTANKSCQGRSDEVKDSWLCRDYRSGDEHQILSLYEQVSGKKMNVDFLKWKFERGPFGRGIIKLMFDGDKLIGHHFAIPIDVQIQAAPVRGTFGMNAVTHPDYREQGIYTYLLRETHKESRQRGSQFEYGFPNQNAYPVLTHRLGWKGLAKMSILYKDLQGESPGLPLSKGIHEICQIEKFGDDVDLLWRKVEREYNVIVPRTKEFLNWRYVERPGVSYNKYVSRESNGQVVGYIILKIFSTETETRGHIVDILSVNDREVVKGLIKRSFDYFIEKGINNVSCWMQDNYSYADALKEEGFVRKEMIGDYPYFGMKVFDGAIALARSMEDITNWYLTMGDDLDVF